MQVPKVMTAALAIGGVVAAVTVGGAGAGAAANTVPHFSGTAGGTYVSGLDGRVASGLTAQSSVDSLTPGGGDSNQIAHAPVAGLADTGAVTTDVHTSRTGSGYAITAHARTAGLSLLGGLITADAVDTTSTATLVDGNAVNNISTTFANLKIAKVNLPVTIAKNTTVTIPGVASITLDYGVSGSSANGSAARGAGMVITLLQGLGNSPAKTVVQLNPVQSSVGLVGAGFRLLGGWAYATKVNAKVGSALQASVGATGVTSMPTAGTSGQDVSNDTAALDLSPLASVRAVGSTATGVATDQKSSAEESVRIAGLNLFNGLITADTLSGSARVAVTGDGAPVATTSSHLANLKIAGKAIPVTVAPNTVINVAGLGKVTINAQYRNGGVAAVRALDITLSTSRLGLPAGAEIEVGYAVVSLNK